MKQFWLTQFGSITNAFILSYATISHQLADIKIALRRRLALVILGIMGAALYWLLLIALHYIPLLDFDLATVSVAIMVAILVVTLVYMLRNSFSPSQAKLLKDKATITTRNYLMWLTRRLTNG